MIERRKILKIGASGIAASIAMPFVGRTGWAATPTHTLKLTFSDTQAHPLYDVLKRFAEDVNKRTSGAIEKNGGNTTYIAIPASVRSANDNQKLDGPTK